MNVLQLFKPINTFVFDVDGVLTDGMLFVMDSGEQVRRMNIKDGYALQLAVKKGYRVIVISGGDSEAVKLRLQKLGIGDVFMKVESKIILMEQLVADHQLDWERILFMGDDIPDLALMRKVGLPCVPADAATEPRSIAKYISNCNGGQGCARDVIEKVLKLNDHWHADDSIVSR